MTHSRIAVAAMLACLAMPAAAQDRGGVSLRNPGSVLDRIESADRSGCRLSQTSVTVGHQGLGSGASGEPPRCRRQASQLATARMMISTPTPVAR